MFIGVKRIQNTLQFGQSDLNHSHHYRNILAFGFVKLLEYYGLDGITKITIEKTDVHDFQNYLMGLGFVPKEKILVLELNDNTRTNFATNFETEYPVITDRKGQLEKILACTMAEPDPKTVKARLKKIVQKVNYRDRLGSEFWDYRAIIKLKNYMNIAISHNDPKVYHNYLNIHNIFGEGTVNKEFIDFFIRTFIGSFKPYIRKAYLEEFFNAIEGKGTFPIAYGQELIEKLLKLITPDDIDKEKYRNWIKSHMREWRKKAELSENEEKTLESKSRLQEEDFAKNIQDPYKSMIQALVDHYNDEKIFFGMENSFH